MMLRISVLGLGACAAICMSASLASAEDIYPPPPPSITLNPNEIELRCSSYVGGDGPWTGALNYRINLSDSTVNGENLQIERIHAKGPESLSVLMPTPRSVNDTTLRFGWHRPANASVPAANYLLDLSNGRLDVTFEYDGRELQRFQLRCIRKWLKLAA
jgi:hypothetical protein